MPFGDGTGPMGQGSGTGRGAGFGRGRGVMGGRSAGIEGYCVCPNCKIRIPHQLGKPCYSIKCPKCGVQMVRE